MLVLEVDSLCKRFGAEKAVEDVSFGVERGQVFGLLGPNGSGKTTTIACALGLLRPDAGSSTVFGHPGSQLFKSAGKLGAVFDQDNLIDGLSVKANLAYAQRLLGHAGGRSQQEVLERTGTARLAARRAHELSLGQRKRVALARALLGRPELLVLDEPLSALDPGGVKDTLQLIRALATEGTSVLLSSHRLHELQSILSHAVLLVEGQVRASGSMQELLNSKQQTFSLGLLDLASTQAAVLWIQSCFPELECRPQAVQGEGLTEFELSGELGRDFAAELCAGLCAQGFKIAFLTPRPQHLDAFFEAHVGPRGARP